jgi:hypothetical protein
MDAAEPGAESDGAAAAPSSRRGPCGSCGAPSRYTCPGCGACSCSAACVSAHKAATGCAGKRRRAAFVPLKAFDDATLRSDLRLLEETQLAAERARRARNGDAQLAQGLPRAALALQKARQTNKRCLTTLSRRLLRCLTHARFRCRRRREREARSCCSRRRAWRGARATPAASGTKARRVSAALHCRLGLTIRAPRIPRRRPSCGMWSGCSPARPCARRVGLRRTFR